jgi:SAM-dependent methyltransferase
MIDRVCPVCGTGEFAKVFAESTVDAGKLNEFAFASRKVPEYMHHRLMQCEKCDLLYADPVPAPEELSVAYRDAAFDSGEEAGFAARTYGRLLPEVERQLPDKVGALDIGTGEGAFLGELLSRGFTQVRGVEPSSAPIAAAKESIRPLIRHGIFKVEDEPAESMSLITCFQTIEHLSEPLAVCRDVLKLLKPGGAMLIACHNRRALTNRVLGQRSPIFDVEHLQLFSPRSAIALLQTAGFKAVGVRTYVNQYPLHYWARLFPLPAGMKPRLIGMLKAIGVGYVPLPMPAGNMAVVGVKGKAEGRRQKAETEEKAEGGNSKAD